MKNVCRNLILFMLFVSCAIHADPKPKIAVFATGGTIAGSNADATSTASYKSAVFTVDEMLKNVTGLSQVAECKGIQVCQIASENMEPAIWLSLRKKILETLSDPNISGAVVTHGTDTMEETAFFLNLTLKTSKPVVLVGSIRPASSISPDGPQNLLNAVRVAATQESAGKGVLIAMNDTIFSARHVQKTDTIRMDAFQGGCFGPVGLLSGKEVQYFFQPLRKHTEESEFNDLGDLKELPRVDIIYCYAGTPAELLDHAVTSGAKGIILACVGDGSLSDCFSVKVKQLTAKGIPIVRSSRIIGGEVVHNGSVDDDEHKTFSSGTLSPHQARVLLQLCLTKYYSFQEIARAFRRY